MNIHEVVTTKDDGSQVRLLAQSMVGRGLHISYGVDVFWRKSKRNNWQLISEEKKFEVVTYAQIIRAILPLTVT